MRTVLAAAISIVLLAAQGAAAQPASKTIQGVWQIVEAVISGPQARTISFKGQPNMTIITAKHYSRVEIQSSAQRPILSDVAKATADELRAAWGPVVTEAGTYELTPAGEITMHPIASKNPAIMGPGVFITYAYKLDGDSLTLTQVRNQNGPYANPFSLKLVRVE